jgi:hypothetical protein
MSRYIFASLAVVLLAGCQTIGLKMPSSLSDKLPPLTEESRARAARDSIPVRIVAIWSDAVYSQAGHAPVRGFGGRLYFYNERHEAVPVDGQLIVYGFDDSTPENPNKTPSRKFVFTDEQLATRHSVTDLGDSYSIWLPWDEVTGFQTMISLLPVFASNQGATVVGPQTVNVLPGKTRPGTEKQLHREGFSTGAFPGNPAIRNVSYESQFGPGGWQIASPERNAQADDARRMKTTTIPLPTTMTQRMLREAESAHLPESTDPQAFPPLQTDPIAGLQPMGPGAITVEPLNRSTSPTSTRFVRPRSQALRAASSQPNRGPVPTPLGPAALPSAPPFGH